MINPSSPEAGYRPDAKLFPLAESVDMTRRVPSQPAHRIKHPLPPRVNGIIRSQHPKTADDACPHKTSEQDVVRIERSVAGEIGLFCEDSPRGFEAFVEPGN